MPHRDDLTDIPRTKAWAKFCRDALDAKSWYVVENALEAGARGRDIKGRICQRGKWTDYSKGIHVPRKRLAEQVELLIPGSLGVLTHQAWQIRDLPPESAAETANRFFSALSLEVRQRLFHRTNELHSGRKRITQQTLVFLETQQDLSGLAALAIIIQEASGNENKRLAFQAGCVLFRALLRLSIEGPAWLVLIATDLFELFRQRVFPHAAGQNFSICLDEVSFPTLAHLVRFSFNNWSEKNKGISPSGFFYLASHQPILTPAGPLMLFVPTKPIPRHTKARKQEESNHSYLIKHWAKIYSNVLDHEDVTNC